MHTPTHAHMGMLVFGYWLVGIQRPGINVHIGSQAVCARLGRCGSATRLNAKQRHADTCVQDAAGSRKAERKKPPRRTASHVRLLRLLCRRWRRCSARPRGARAPSCSRTRSACTVPPHKPTRRVKTQALLGACGRDHPRRAAAHYAARVPWWAESTTPVGKAPQRTGGEGGV